MKKDQQKIPPGHTKPPIRAPRVVNNAKTLSLAIDPRKLPRPAQLILLIAFAGTGVALLMDPEPLSLIVLICLLCVGAFGEAMHDKRDAKKPAKTIGQYFDRGLANMLWVGASVLPILLCGLWVRRNLGFGGVFAQ